LQIAATIEGSGPIAAYFGGAAERELVVVVTNPGTVPVAGATLSLFAGKDAVPSAALDAAGAGQPLPIGAVAPGQSVTVRQPFTIDAPAFGDYRVRGVVAGSEIDVVEGATTTADDFIASTSSYPWAWILIGWLLLLLVLVRAVRSRGSAESDADPLAATLPVLDATAASAASAPVPPVVPGAGAGVVALPQAPVEAPAPAAVPPAPAAPAPPAPPAPPVPAPTIPAAAPTAPAAPPPPSGYALVDAPPPAPTLPPVAAPVAAAGAGEVLDAEIVDPEPDDTASTGVFGVDDLRRMMDQRDPNA
jgi:hypothetical protein